MRPVARGLVLVLGLALVLPAAPAAARQTAGKVYVVMVFDTDAHLGSLVLKDKDGRVRKDKEGKDLVYRLGSLTAALAKDEEMLKKVLEGGIGSELLRIKILHGEQVTEAKLRQCVESFAVTPDDTLVCIFGGHGTTDEGTREHCLLFTGSDANPAPTNREITPVPRSRVRAILTAQQPRLAVLLTNACSNNMPLTTGDGGGELGFNIQAPSRGLASPGFKALFLDPRGVVDVNASYEGTLAWNHDERGSVFALALTDALVRNKDNPELTWPAFYNGVKVGTEKTFKAWKEEAKKAGKMPLEMAQQDRQTTQAFFMTGTRMKVFTAAVPGGQRVVELPLDSPGRTAGLEVNDLIVSVNGTPVLSNAAWKTAVTDPLRQGTTQFRLVVQRGGAERTVDLALPRE